MSLWVGRLIVNVYNFQINTLNSVNIQVKNIVNRHNLEDEDNRLKMGEKGRANDTRRTNLSHMMTNNRKRKPLAKNVTKGQPAI